MISSCVARTLFLVAIAFIAPACDPIRSGEGDLARRQRAESDEFANALTWGCEQAVSSKVDKLDPRWREEATVVGDFGFGVTVGDFSGFRPHKRADFRSSSQSPSRAIQGRRFGSLIVSETGLR